MGKHATKVFLLHNVISPERLPIFEALSRKVDLDVYFCTIQSKYRRSKAELLKKYSFSSNILKSIVLNLGDKHPLVISYNLLFKLLFKPYDYYIVCENLPIMLTTVIILLVTRLFGKPFILWSGVIEHNYKETWQKNPIKNLLVKIYRKFLYKCSNSFIAYGEMARKYLIKQGVSKNSISIGTQVIADELSEDLSLGSDHTFAGKTVVLFVGHFRKRKGMDYLIKAFKSLKRNDSVLVIAGSGEEEDHLKSLAEGTDHILFPGFVQGQQKTKYYSLADIFVLPTLDDCWGLVVNEAMSFGLPIIVTEKAGCAPELVKDNGIIVPAGNVEALKGAMQKLLDNDRLRRQMGWKSKEYIKKYDVNYAVNAFVNTIKYVSSRKTLQ